MSDKDQNLLDQLDREAASGWRPEPGDTLLGTAVAVHMRDPQNGYDTYPVLTIRKDDGTEVAVHAFHFVLRQQLEQEKPKAGQRVAIKFAGERQGADRSYKDYRVAVDRPAGEDFEWGSAPAPSSGVEPLTDADRAALAQSAPQPQQARSAAQDEVPF